jgi:hypothetical protein
VNATERSMLHDTMAEMVTEYSEHPTEEGRHILLGMRIMAGTLGMPEGHSNYEWAHQVASIESRRSRRLVVMSMLAHHRKHSQ